MKKFIIVLAIFCLPFISQAYFDVSLKYGSKGEAVVELQDFLQDQELYTGSIDGKFGLGMVKAVKAFQKAQGLKSDGYFGKASRDKANIILSDILKDSNDSEVEEVAIFAPLTPFVPVNPIIPESVPKPEQPIAKVTAPVVVDTEKPAITEEIRFFTGNDSGWVINFNELVTAKISLYTWQNSDKTPKSYLKELRNGNDGLENLIAGRYDNELVTHEYTQFNSTQTPRVADFEVEKGLRHSMRIEATDQSGNTAINWIPLDYVSK